MAQQELSQRVLQRLGAAHAPEELLQLVTFDVGTEEYAFDIRAVREINRMMTLTRIPDGPSDVEGIINLRGQIIPVIDLRKRFGLPAEARTHENRIVVVETLSRVMGVIVDRVHEVLRIRRDIVEGPPALSTSAGSEYVSGIGRLEDRLLILLDLDRLLETKGRDHNKQAAA